MSRTGVTRRIFTTSAASVAVLFAVSACSSSSNSSPSVKDSSSDVLHVAYYDDMGAPDPDSFYGTEGLMVTGSVYDGLLQYAPNSTKIVADLASLPAISTDGLTYTFQLHPGAKFHDGTAVDSAAAKASFARRTLLNQGPAYMLAGVSSVDTPGPLTVVVHLKSPVSAFLDYLASAWGPKIVDGQ